MKRLILIAGVVFTVLIACSSVMAQHTALRWYEPSELDVDINKLDDMLDLMSPTSQPEVCLCFKNDCVPDSLLAVILDMGGELGYRSPRVASVFIRGLSVSELQTVVAAWDDVGWIVPNDTLEFHMQTAGQALAAHSGTYSPNTAEDAGFDGTGITIAILDSGVDNGHPDLPVAVGGLLIMDAFAGTFIFGDPGDNVGHGTAVAGCALGRGSGPGRTNRGMAPGADLFDCRVVAPGAGGVITSASIMALVDWIALNWNTVVPPIRVLNISIGKDAQSAGSPVTAAINACVQAGVVVCVSAGNHDSWATDVFGNPAGIGHIAVAERAITVAAATHSGTANRADDAISDFSRVGPGIGPEPKPNITAMGEQCTAAWPSGCALGTSVDLIQTTNTVGTYGNFGGTSAAAPMVSGACALVLERNPAMNPAAVKTLLLTNAEDRGPAGWDPSWGDGLLDLRSIFAAPPAPCDLMVQQVSFTPYPIVDCNAPVTVTVKVKNNEPPGGASVTNYSVSMEYWYLTVGNPAVRYPLTAAPIPNTFGPLNPQATQDFVGTFDLKMVTTPMSEHTCFWGIVNNPTDPNPSNDERNINATVKGLTGTSCKLVCGGNPADTLGDTMLVAVRLAHKIAFPIPIDVGIYNPDSANWNVYLEHEGEVDEYHNIDVDPGGCPVEVNVCAYAYDPGVSDSVEILVYSFNETYGVYGEATITFLAQEPDICCGINTGGITGNVNCGSDGKMTLSDITRLIDRVYISKLPLCCEASGNTNGSVDCNITLSDITVLIDAVYISKTPPAECRIECEM